MHFIETPVFTRLIAKHLDEPSYRALQLALLLRPESGRLIPGSGGLRKVRWMRAGGGKRGGMRVIYYWDVQNSICYLLFVYRKSEQGDLSRAQVRYFRKLMAEELP